MKLKCIGGPLDGQEKECDAKLHNIVRISLPSEFKATLFEVDMSKTPSDLVYSYAKYKVCKINGINFHGDRQELKYLCYCDWHEWEAILHQFRK